MIFLDVLIILILSFWVVFSIIYIVKCKQSGKCIGCSHSCNLNDDNVEINSLKGENSCNKNCKSCKKHCQ